MLKTNNLPGTGITLNKTSFLNAFWDNYSNKKMSINSGFCLSKNFLINNFL